MRDHHIVHAARGISQVWTAAIVAGLAVVLTGAIAWSAVDAQVRTTTDPTQALIRESFTALNRRMDSLEGMLRQLTGCKSGICAPDMGAAELRLDPTKDAVACRELCVAEGTACQKNATAKTGDFCSENLKTCVARCAALETKTEPVRVVPEVKPPVTNDAVACRESCNSRATTCQRNAGFSRTAAEVCSKDLTSCLTGCRTTTGTAPVAEPSSAAVCRESCNSRVAICQRSAGSSISASELCASQFNSCLTSCTK